MIDRLLAPGSFRWLVAHDVRLNWRMFVDVFGQAIQTRALLVLAGGATALHVLAWPIAPFFADFAESARTTGEGRLAIGAVLVCVASWMMAQGLFAATRTLYDRGDLDLLYSSPLERRNVLAAKATAIALSSLGSVALLALPIANVGALRFGPQWLAVYPALAGVALFATALALGATIILFRTFPPHEARRYAHLAGALIGGAFVLGGQIVALLPADIRQSLMQLLAPPAQQDVSAFSRLLWLPVDAALADPVAMVVLVAGGVIAFVLAACVLGDRFADVSVAASGASDTASSIGKVRRVSFHSSPIVALRRKEWRLLVRDPGLFAQLGLQIVYTIPLVVILVRSGKMPIGLAVAPALVVIASQVAASLAWIAVSGEDAPELIATAPVKARVIDVAKLSAIALPVLMVAGVPALVLAASSPRSGLLALLFAAGASVTTALLNLWHPMPGNRRGMLRRHSQSKLVGLVEHLLAILWAAGTVFALLGSWLWVVPVALALFVLALGDGRLGKLVSPFSRRGGSGDAPVTGSGAA